MPKPKIMSKYNSKILDIRFLDSQTFILRFERNGLKFRTGQYVVLAPQNFPESREYSIYSSEHDPWIEVLIKKVDTGYVSKALSEMQVGDMLQVEGPYGFFVLNQGEIDNRHFLFVATGTGISPFHSFTLTHSSLNYQLLHGVRFTNEAYDHGHYLENSHVICTTRDEKGSYAGRVTEYLSENDIPTDTICYLCGNSAMINEVSDLLEEQGIAPQNIRSEVFF
ncbi:oxidoreductase [Prolixibacteraceae bacterium JC049]|nr:oxidoreductase [Prolixibacteraceae bacterium JC049]